jgi:hypothetical protein
LQDCYLLYNIHVLNVQNRLDKNYDVLLYLYQRSQHPLSQTRRSADGHFVLFPAGSHHIAPDANAPLPKLTLTRPH